MDIIGFEEKEYLKMKQSFEEFIKEVKGLCQENPDLHSWLDNQQVCLLLDISKRRLQYYRDSGILPFSQMGHKCYYKKKDVELLIEKSTIINE